MKKVNSIEFEVVGEYEPKQRFIKSAVYHRATCSLFFMVQESDLSIMQYSLRTRSFIRRQKLGDYQRPSDYIDPDRLQRHSMKMHPSEELFLILSRRGIILLRPNLHRYEKILGCNLSVDEFKFAGFLFAPLIVAHGESTRTHVGTVGLLNYRSCKKIKGARVGNEKRICIIRAKDKYSVLMSHQNHVLGYQLTDLTTPAKNPFLTCDLKIAALISFLYFEDGSQTVFVFSDYEIVAYNVVYNKVIGQRTNSRLRSYSALMGDSRLLLTERDGKVLVCNHSCAKEEIWNSPHKGGIMDFIFIGEKPSLEFLTIGDSNDKRVLPKVFRWVKKHVT